MAYYVVCPHCGCNLDPCERCDCETPDPLDIWPDADEMNGPETQHRDVLVHSY
jgi:hypothetical protein